MNKEVKILLASGVGILATGYIIMSKKWTGINPLSRPWPGLANFDRKNSLAIFIPKLKK